MSTESWIELTVAILALALLGLAALIEASLSSVSRVTLRAWFEERIAANRVQSLMERPQTLRSTMLLVELIAAGVIAVMLTDLFSREMGNYGWLVGLAVTIGLVTLAGRVIPGALITSDRLADSRGLERLAAPIAALVAPITFVADRLTRWLASLAGHRSNGTGEDDDGPAASRANGAHDEPDDAADIEEAEEEMISGILRLDRATAREIMVPRPDVVAVPVDMPALDVVDVVRKAGHSRVPVYRDSIDTIVGVVYAKDFLRFVREDLDTVDVMGLVRPAYYVPESKRVDELLKDLRQQKVHLAVVVDEYGGTAGIVTIEDIIEEIVGEIQDEYDQETPLVERVSADEAIVDGRISVEEVAEIFETTIAEGDFETIGGFVQKMLGHIPQAGETLRADGLLIEVQTVERRRIRKLRVVRAPETAPASDHQSPAS